VSANYGYRYKVSATDTCVGGVEVPGALATAICQTGLTDGAFGGTPPTPPAPCNAAHVTYTALTHTHLLSLSVCVCMGGAVGHIANGMQRPTPFATFSIQIANMAELQAYDVAFLSDVTSVYVGGLVVTNPRPLRVNDTIAVPL
jgi:hypothetical protein